MPGQHRSPPPTPHPGWRWHTVAALAGLGILAPPVTLWAEAVAPDATARSQVSTVTRAERTGAGPLVLPTIGAEGAWTPPEETTTEPVYAPSPSVASRSSRGHAPAPFIAPTVTTGPGMAIPAADPTPTVTTTPAAPPTDPIAAATRTSSATTTEEPVMTPTATVTVDVTAEVTP